MKARLLPLIAVAAGGVIAVKAISSIEGVPAAFAGARAFAEEALAPAKDKASKADQDAKAAVDAALPPPSKPPAPVCAPTAAELARQAGLSPAELQILQSLSARRGALDLREADVETQIALMAAAEAKLEAKITAMNGLKTEINGMLGQVDAAKNAEVMRLITVYQAMKPKDAAARMTLLADDVRLPMASKMKERSLSAILAQMPVPEAKSLTEKLAGRYDPRLLAAARAAANAAQPANAQAPQAAPAAAAAPALKPAAPTLKPASADPLEAEAKAAPTPAKTAQAPSKAPPAKRPAAKPRPKPKAPVKTAAAPAKAAPVSDGPKPYASLQPSAPAKAEAKAEAAPAAKTS